MILTLVFTTSCNKDKNNPSDDSEVVWSANLELFINPALGRNYMPAVDENDNIYVMMADWDGNAGLGYALQAFDKDGKQLWIKTDDNVSVFTQMVTYFDGKIIYPTSSQIVCLNSSDGTEAWTYTPPDSLQTTYSIAIANNQLVAFISGFTSEYSYIYSFNPANGNINATEAFGGREEVCAMAANGSTLYITYNSLSSYNINTNSIDLNWSSLLPNNNAYYEDTYRNMLNDITIDPVNGNIFFAYENPTQYGEKWLIAYDKNGNKLWENETFQATHITACAENELYVSYDNLFKLNGQSGSQIWEAVPPSETMGLGNSINSTVYGNDDVLYAGDIYGIYGINNQGTEKYSAFPTSITGNGTPFTYVTLLSNGNIIVLAMSVDPDTEPAKIYCLKASSGGVKKNIWAKWGANAANTFNLQ